jgi:hypothetical protein
MTEIVKYRNWTKEAILDLGNVMDQVCGVHEKYMKQFDLQDYIPIKNRKNTTDDINDPFIKNFVIPDLLNVKCVFYHFN